MKAILLIMMLVGVFLMGHSLLTDAKMIVVGYQITDPVLALKNTTNVDEVDRVVQRIFGRLDQVHSLFRPMAWSGGIIFCCSVAGLVIEFRRRKRKTSAQPTAAASPSVDRQKVDGQ
jgi:hypothetical protein